MMDSCGIPIIYTFVFLAVIFMCLYRFGTRNHDFYAKKNIPYVKPLPFLGNLAPMLFSGMAQCDHILWLYNELKGNVAGGMFGFTTPALLIRDLSLIKDVCVRDFDYFVDRRILLTEEVDPIAGKVLPSLTGDRWRYMRSLITPAFTPSKIKDAYSVVHVFTKEFIHLLLRQIDQPKKTVLKIQSDHGILHVEMRDIVSRYCTDALAIAILGIKSDSLGNPNNKLYKMCELVSNFEGAGAFKLLGHLFSPKLMKLLNIRIVDSRAMSFFRSLVYDMKKARRRDGSSRLDVFSLLMQAQNSQSLLQDTQTNSDLDDDSIAAQMMLVFLAGIETISTLVCFATHLIATHRDVQARLWQEIQLLLKKNSADMDYEQLHSLKYLDMVLSETLRLYPPVEVIDRKCVQPYNLEGTQFTFQEGDGLLIPIYAIQRDPAHFPDPERFFPDRFNEENKQNIKPFSYLPFGVGPRNCIGSKFAITIAKLFLAKLLLHFDLQVIEKTPIPIRMVKLSFNKRVVGGFWLGLKPREYKT